MTQASCGRHSCKGRRILWECQSMFKAGSWKSVHVLAIRASVSWMRTYRKMIERSSWICRQRCMHLVCVIEVGGGNERVTTRRKRVWSTRNIRTSLKHRFLAIDISTPYGLRCSQPTATVTKYIYFTNNPHTQKRSYGGTPHWNSPRNFPTTVLELQVDPSSSSILTTASLCSTFYLFPV